MIICSVGVSPTITRTKSLVCVAESCGILLTVGPLVLDGSWQCLAKHRQEVYIQYGPTEQKRGMVVLPSKEGQGALKRDKQKVGLTWRQYKPRIQKLFQIFSRIIKWFKIFNIWIWIQTFEVLRVAEYYIA